MTIKTRLAGLEHATAARLPAGMRRFATYDGGATFAELTAAVFDHEHAPDLQRAVLWRGDGWAPFVRVLTRADVDAIKRSGYDVIIVDYVTTPLP